MSTNPITLRKDGAFGVDGMAATNSIGRYIRLEQVKALTGSSNERNQGLGLGKSITLHVLENIGADVTLEQVEAMLDERNASGGVLYSVLADNVELCLTDKQQERLTEEGITDAEAAARLKRYEERFTQNRKNAKGELEFAYFSQTFMWGSPRASEDLRSKVAQPSGALTAAKAKVEVN